MFKMMKIKCKFRVSLLIGVGIFCLITSSCESNFEKKDPFKVISLEPLSDEIPFKELGSGKILFYLINSSDNSGLYVIDIDQKITYGFTLNSSIQMPYISPDGSKIACLLRKSTDPYPPTWNIYCMNIDGSNCIPVTKDEGGSFPTWTPDGLKILYKKGVSWDGHLYMLSATENSTDRVELIKFAYDDDPGSCIVACGGFSMSPNGQLVCASPHGCINTDGILMIEPYIGQSGVSLLLPNTLNEQSIIAVFSPDGTKIAMATQEKESLNNQQAMWIKSMDPDGTNLTPLASIKTSRPLINYFTGDPLISLCWSPDGKKILFNAPNEQNDGFHLMLVNADGTGLIQVTDKMSVNDLYVSWGR